MISIFIPMEPVPQGRPKFRRHATFVQTYDPGKSRDYKKELSDAVKKLNVVPFAKDLPLVLSIRFLLTKPKSVKRVFPVVKPDLDNLVKAVKDALKGIAWHDDSQVCDSRESKRYAISEAGMYIEVRELKE